MFSPYQDYAGFDKNHSYGLFLIITSSARKIQAQDIVVMIGNISPGR